MLDALDQEHWRRGPDWATWRRKQLAQLHVWNAFGRPSEPTGAATADDRAHWRAYQEARIVVGLVCDGKLTAADGWDQVSGLLDR